MPATTNAVYPNIMKEIGQSAGNILTELHAPFNKLPEPLQKEHLWLEQHFFQTLDFKKGPAMMESWRSS